MGKVTLIAVLFRRHGRDDLLSIRSSLSNPDSILAVMKLKIISWMVFIPCSVDLRTWLVVSLRGWRTVLADEGFVIVGAGLIT
jgi:hypothetical protein